MMLDDKSGFKKWEIIAKQFKKNEAMIFRS